MASPAKHCISTETLFIAAGLVIANSVLLFQVAILRDSWWLKATTVSGMAMFVVMIFVGRSPSLSRTAFNVLLNLTLFSFFGYSSFFARMGCCSFFSARISICRMRSRVTLNRLPSSSSV